MIWLKSGDFVLREGLQTPLGSFSGVSGEIFSMPRTNDNCFPDSWCLFEVKRFCQSPSQPYKCKEILKIYLISRKILLTYIFRMFHFFGCCWRGHGIILRSRCGKFICWKVDRFNMVSKLFHQAPEKINN